MTTHDIGEFVWVLARTVKSVSDCHVVTWERIPYAESVIGRIVGRTTRFNGCRTRSCGTYDHYGEYEQGFLAVSGSVSLWLVRFGMFNLPIFVQESDLRTCTPDEIPEFPRLKSANSWNQPSAQEVKDYLRQEMAAWPRDARGRWKKYKAKQLQGDHS